MLLCGCDPVFSMLLLQRLKKTRLLEHLFKYYELLYIVSGQDVILRGPEFLFPHINSWTTVYNRLSKRGALKETFIFRQIPGAFPFSPPTHFTFALNTTSLLILHGVLQPPYNTSNLSSNFLCHIANCILAC